VLYEQSLHLLRLPKAIYLVSLRQPVPFASKALLQGFEANVLGCLIPDEDLLANALHLHVGAVIAVL